VHVTHLRDAFLDLAVSHFHLASIKIQGIPMKDSKAKQGELEKSTGKKLSEFPVELLYPTRSYLALSMSSSFSFSYFIQADTHIGHVLGSGFWHQTTRRQPVLWKTTDRTVDLDTLPCRHLYRVTPVELDPPTRALIRFVKGSAVTLSIPDPKSKIGFFLFLIMVAETVAKSPASHVILNHNDNIYLHELYNDFISLDRLPLQMYDIRATKDGFRTHVRGCVLFFGVYL